MRTPLRLNFQAKVLIPVVGIMTVLIVLSMWTVNRQMSRQLERSAAESITTADAVFKSLQRLRARSLRLQYGNLANEPRFKAIAQHPDPKTVTVLLREILEEVGGDVALFANLQAQSVARFSRDSLFNLDQFATATAETVERALRSPAAEPCDATVAVGGELFEILSIPVSVGDEVVGAFTFGIRLGDSVLQELKQITRTEILMFAGEQIAATTISSDDWSLEADKLIRGFVQADTDRKGPYQSRPETMIINGFHYMLAVRQLVAKQSGPQLRYVLLSSYERPLQEFQANEQNFLWVQLAGTVLGGVLVCWLVRRVTNPLRQLRAHAEAVGHGDFSRRLAVHSHDECGELATVFNQMTQNLQNSQQELEATVKTLQSTQAQLNQSEKLRAIGTLAGGIAHDFNNILAAILGYGEMALEDVAPGSRTANSLRQVVQAGLRAKDLIRQILAFSRQNQPQRTAIRLSAIVDETVRLLRAAIPSTIEIRTSLRAQTDTVVADPSQLHQVLMNLGTNASHAMREKGGVLAITLDDFVVPASPSTDSTNLHPGAYLRLTVSDTGHGMTPQVLDRIFEPFFTTKPVGEGTGLGLSVVHGIIKNHGGEVTVTSQPGTGTTFAIFLPVATGTAFAPNDAERVLPGRAERILVVDDEESLVQLLQQKLSRLGYEVVAHCDSLAALHEFRSATNGFDLVITDQTMPHLTGLDLAKKIVELRPDIPVILCSGSGNAALGTQPVAGPIKDRISKPINFAELSRSIRRALERPTL